MRTISGAAPAAGLCGSRGSRPSRISARSQGKRRILADFVSGGADEPPPAPVNAAELFANLQRLSPRSRLAVIQSVEEYRTPDLARRCREEARRHAADPRRAASWEKLAAEIGP